MLKSRRSTDRSKRYVPLENHNQEVIADILTKCTLCMVNTVNSSTTLSLLDLTKKDWLLKLKSEVPWLHDLLWY